MVLGALPVSPGCCSPVLVLLKQGTVVCKNRQHLACRMAATAAGYGQEQEWMGSQWMPPFRAQSWKGTIVICMPAQLHPMTWWVEPFTVDPGTDDRAGILSSLLASGILWARIESSWLVRSSLWAFLLMARHTQCWADQCNENCILTQNTQRPPIITT